MTFKEAQKETDDWIKQCGYGYFTPHEILARLMEETGELAREVNHEFGPKKKKPTEADNSIGDEVADIFFTLVCMANSLNIDLDEKWKKMMDKYYKRDESRWKQK